MIRMRPNELLRQLHEANKYMQARLDQLEQQRLREIARIAEAYGTLLQLSQETEPCR
jgi:hypothetical protein